MFSLVIAFATALSSSGLDVPDSLRTSSASPSSIPWHSIAKGMMAGGAVAGLVVGPIAYILPRLDAAEISWKCMTNTDSLVCKGAQEPLPHWPETIIPVGLGFLAAGFVLHLFTLDDAREQMKIFARPRDDGFQILVVCRL